ncbi:MAG: DUF433 domain-containing protein [Planctomycetes bacterium]|nr:DUF433 domain-containing protein [Planctomycetota bacterium]
MRATAWPFIVQDPSGSVFVEGTTTKVIEIALDRLAYEWDAEEIARQHPHLSLPQIHAALGYYFENRDECDQIIEERLSRASEILGRRENLALQAKLRGHARK